MANSGEKIKVPIFIRRKGADAFRPALAAGGLLMACKCLSLCDFFIVQHFFKLCHIRFVLLEDFSVSSFGVGIVRQLRQVSSSKIKVLLNPPDSDFQR